MFGTQVIGSFEINLGSIPCPADFMYAVIPWVIFSIVFINSQI